MAGARIEVLMFQPFTAAGRELSGHQTVTRANLYKPHATDQVSLEQANHILHTNEHSCYMA